MKQYLFALTSAIILASCVNEDDFQVQPPADTQETVVNSAYVAGRMYVKFSDEMLNLIENDLTDGDLVTRSVGLNQSLESLGISSIERVFTIGGEYEARQRKAGLHKWYVVTYAPTVPVTKATDDLVHIDGIESAEPVRQIAFNDEVVFNDLNSDLWGLHNVQYPGIDINVKPVWQHYTVGNPNVIVAVVDSGVDVKHPDLKDNCTEKHYSFTKGALAPEEHGTHVAGTIAATGNNGIGVCGVAGGDYKARKPGVKITSFQIFEGDKRVPQASADAIRAAADNGAVICQNSWGYVYDLDDNQTISADEYALAKLDNINGPDKEAIDYFIANAGCDNDGNQREDSPMKGGLVVFAAGNDAIDIGWPANYHKVVAVGAVDRDGRRADFSNYGDWVDIAAPGVAIKSTLPGSNYGLKQGTSMACPHVSGVAALILSYYAGPGFTADMLKEKLLGGANKAKTSATDKIGPLVDAYGSLTYGDNVVPNPVDDISAEGRGDNIDLTWTQTDDEKGKPVHGVMIVYGTDRGAVEAATPRSYTGCSIFTSEVNDSAVGEEVSRTLRSLEFDRLYYCKLFNYTYSLVYSEPSEIIEVRTTDNHAPAVELSDDEVGIMAHQVVKVQVSVSDVDDHSITVKYESGSVADKLISQNDIHTIVITGNAAPEGSYKGRLTVTDQHGLSSYVELSYTLLPNKKPVKIKDIEDIYLKSRAEYSIDMSEYVTDPDGEQLVYKIEVVNPQVVFFSPQNDVIYLTPLAYGQSDVKVIASDARDEKVEFEFNILIKDPSIAVSAYPNPVKDYLNVSTGDPAETSITIYSATGSVVYDYTSEVSAREPARIDMRDFAPGVYKMTVKFSGKEYSETVVKL